MHAGFGILMAKSGKEKPHGVRILNRRARHEYAITEVVECGLELTGTEVKSLRAGQAKIDEAYARVLDGQAFLLEANISPYDHAAPGMQHEPKRARRLLLHRAQIRKLLTHATQKGQTIVPLAVYFKHGWAKCELGLAVGKQLHDKRRSLKEREQKRDVDRELRRRR